MKKDIPDLKVEDVVIAIAPAQASKDDNLWNCYLINLKEKPIKNVLVNSKGYGEIEGERRKTSILRHYFEVINPQTGVLVEPIQTKLFSFTNEYWVSFVLEGHMYDKKYVFVKGSIDELNFTKVPILEREGVMIK